MPAIESLNLDGPMDLLMLKAVIERGLVEFSENGLVVSTNEL